MKRPERQIPLINSLVLLQMAHHREQVRSRRECTPSSWILIKELNVSCVGNGDIRQRTVKRKLAIIRVIQKDSKFMEYCGGSCRIQQV